PGNPLLAESMYLTRYIERMGTGIGDMIRRCREAGLPEPEFSVSDGFQTIIRRERTTEPREEPSEKTSEEPSEKTSKKILAMIRKQPEITIREMADALGISTRAVEMQLAKLKESGRLQRIGPAKGGHWNVPGESDE
ncbi:MAG TPA: winged helix-turn-helix transcriptional regulator, partial [Syntrophales bacterium]|nr:winged helix-turn-helix transcriptional regulator [Syntrophales bacterium]